MCLALRRVFLLTTRGHVVSSSLLGPSHPCWDICIYLYMSWRTSSSYTRLRRFGQSHSWCAIGRMRKVRKSVRPPEFVMFLFSIFLLTTYALSGDLWNRSCSISVFDGMVSSWSSGWNHCQLIQVLGIRSWCQVGLRHTAPSKSSALKTACTVTTRDNAHALCRPRGSGLNGHWHRLNGSDCLSTVLFLWSLLLILFTWFYLSMSSCRLCSTDFSWFLHTNVPREKVRVVE